MATSGSWRIFGSVTGLPSGTRSVDVSINAGATAPDQTTTQSINGFAAVAVPTGYSGVLIIPPSANVNTITLKGITGDTGVPLSPSQPSAIALGTGVTTIGITTSAATVITFIFI